LVFLDRVNNKKFQVKAKYVANCTGVWADEIRLKDNPEAKRRICIVGGSHLTYDSQVASNKFGLCLPSKDGRVLLVVPWLNKVIAGTT
jgi:glycerol-3-phosphate dehydrogenase